MGRPPQAPPLEIYLTGGEYTFGYPGNSTTPQFPPIRSRVVIHGGGATVRFQPEVGALIPDWLNIGEGAELSLHHLTLAGSDGRLILNRGVLHLADVRLTNDSGGPDYTLPDGGGIANYGTLTLTRTRLDHNRILTATTPGGAIWNAGSLTATCATFADSRASKGGAVWNAAGGQAAFTKVKFAGNVANGGGAVFNADAAHIVQITDGWWGGATPAFNDATQGTDTLGGLVSYTAAASDPLTAPDCQSPPPEPPPAGNTSLFSAASVPEVSSVQLPASIPPGGVARGKIAFMSNRNGNSDLYLMDTNGANVTQVTSTTGWEESPTWSPDGQKLVYKVYGVGWKILSLNDLSNPRDVNIFPYTMNELGPQAESASWYPTGEYLAFPLNNDIYRVDVDGGGLTQIIDNSIPILQAFSTRVSITNAAWSPSGNQIAFTVNSERPYPESETYHVYVADVTAGQGAAPSIQVNSIRRLFPVSFVYAPYSLVWSPDSQEIALWLPDSPIVPTPHLMAVNVTTLSRRMLVRNPYPDAHSGWFRGVSWSKQNQIAFAISDLTDLNWKIHLADPIENTISQAANPVNYLDEYPDFSPNACFGYESGGVCRIGQDLVQITATPLFTSCQIKFTTQFKVREKGNKAGKILISTVQGQAYTAYKKSPPSLDESQIWVEIEYEPSKTGWIQAQKGVESYVDPSTLACFASLPTYTGIFPSGWEQIARINTTKIPAAANGGMLSYLYSEGLADPALLLARLAISESASSSESNGIEEGVTRESYRREVEFVAWTVRMRAFIGLLNYSPSGSLRILNHNGTLVTFTSTGKAGQSTSIVNDLIFSTLQRTSQQGIVSILYSSGGVYEPLTNIAWSSDPSLSIGNLAAGFYPKDIFALDDLYDAYQRTKIIIAENWSAYNTNIIGYEEWVGGLPKRISRPPRPDSRYPIRASIQPNGQNSFYDKYDIDDYWLTECVAQGGNTIKVFPGNGYNLIPAPENYFFTDLPVPPVCKWLGAVIHEKNSSLYPIDNLFPSLLIRLAAIDLGLRTKSHALKLSSHYRRFNHLEH